MYMRGSEQETNMTSQPEIAISLGIARIIDYTVKCIFWFYTLSQDLNAIYSMMVLSWTKTCMIPWVQRWNQVYYLNEPTFNRGPCSFFFLGDFGQM